MRTPPSNHPAASYLIRHFVEILTLFAVLFVLQAGLVPFDFGEGTEGDGMARFFGAQITRFTLPDIVSNIFLYVPIGFLGHCSLSRAMRSRSLAVVVAILLATALSLVVEFLQAYSPSRVSSSIDFTANVAGGVVGAVVSWCAQWMVPKLGALLFREFHEKPHDAMVKSYVCALVFFAALPFSFSFDSTRLKRCLKSTTLIPFQSLATCDVAAEAAVQKDDTYKYALARWTSMKHWSRWVGECVSFAFLAWLVHTLLQDNYGFGPRAATALVWWTGGGLAIGLSLLQLPILTRGFDVTDILFRWSGLAAGLAVRSIHRRETGALSPGDRAVRWQRRARLACGAALLYILYTGLIPAVFDLERGGPVQAATSEGFLPFFAYFVTRFDIMMDDVMEKFCSFGVLAALVVTARPRLQLLPTRSRIVAMAAVGVCLSALIEIVQMYIPVRTTTLSDPIVAACGCAVGVLVQEHVVGFYRFATSVERAAPATTARAPHRRPRLAPTDELIATLTEPRAEAPTEPAPAPRRSRNN